MRSSTTGRRMKDPFRPQPHLRIAAKSRRHFPVGQTAGFCIRASRCANTRKCEQCVPLYRLWKALV